MKHQYIEYNVRQQHFGFDNLNSIITFTSVIMLTAAVVKTS